MPGNGEEPTAIGREAIRAGLAGFVAMRPTEAAMRPRVVAEAGDVAVLYNDWTGKGTGPDGQAIDMAGKAIEVVRRQADGTWKFIFDDPFARG